ncbi:hypothetical protein SSX86_016178 [Deinandra increscens subsp. villosa]|uniref:ZF-HD dimerization-type domain-containing protein n=1 Tax=Deinandra increscens subsp. villosa TaxID=3103831 RepID=A0AAP0CXF9_9ASTR
MKNHAAAMGGHAIDGCGEFMPSPTSSPTSPTSLKCAACGCHRNFHRREPEESFFPPPIQHVIEYQPHHRHHPPPPPSHQIPTSAAADGGAGAAGSPGNSPSPPPISSSYYPSAPHMLLALSSGGASAPPSDNNNHHIPALPTTPGSGSNPAGKKRFRTKFTQDQKEKMHEIAERVGWKMQKRDEAMIVGFCNQIGVDKNVFKVWMHNNKTTFGSKKDFANSSGEGIDFIISRNNNHHRDDDVDTGNNRLDHLHLYSNGGGDVICPKGSSSSS